MQRFSAAGEFIAQFGDSGSEDGQLDRPQGLAVDPVSGDVYVADTDNNRVQRFTSEGVYVSQLGSPAGGSGDGEFFGPRRVAVDSSGRLYVLDDGNGRIQRFTASGTFDGVFGAESVVVGGPSEITVDPVNDHVYVSGSTADFSAEGVVELDPAGVATDVHAANISEISTFGGLAVRSSTGRIYGSDLLRERVIILDEVAAPTVAIDPVSEIEATAAKFSGEVNPQGPPSTGYRFEYSTDGVNWAPVPAGGDVGVGLGTADVAVSQTVQGLAPNTEYRVRLVATKDFNAGGATSGEVTFTTSTSPPQVRALGAGSITDMAAWLGGEVNPRNSPATGYVEYTRRTDTGYTSSSRVPVAPDAVDVGSGNEYVRVIELASGLEPGTDYRYRVVASNQAGMTVGPDRVFTTRKASPDAPLGRGYEMVSPADKNSGDIDRNLGGSITTSGASVSGDVVAYASTARFAEPVSGDSEGQYRSVRDVKSGWSTRVLNPPFETDPKIDINQANTWFLSDDLSRAVVATNFPLDPLSPLLGATSGLYLQDNSGSSSSYRLLSIPDSSLPLQDTRFPFEFVAAAPDLGHVVFDSRGAQLTSDPIPAEPATGVYEWADGQVRLVSKLPSGVSPASAAAGSGGRNGRFRPGEHVISDDGRRIFFTTTASNSPAPVYVREDGSVTRAVSVSERDGDDPSVGRDATFLAAKADDGSLALFSSYLKLTDDATACDGFCAGGLAEDLYLWDADAPEGQQLTDLTTADPDGGGVRGIAGVADDLSRAYFVATGNLAAGAASDGRPNLYVWSTGEGVRHVATLSATDEAIWGTDRVDEPHDARLSTDGSRLLFASRAQITAQDTGGTKQVYLYDADEERLVCASCNVSVPSGDSWLFYPPDLGLTPRMPYRLPRNLSADGRRVFFETAQGLVERDVNGRADVYMWEGGELSLISTGKSDERSEFVDASASGSDVFFTTRERLVGSDVDDQVDVYDARVGGGFTEQQIPPECIGDECQGSLAAAPKLSDLAGGAGAGDGSMPERASLTVGSLSSGARRALAAGRKAALVVRVNKAGRVTVRGSARIAGKKQVVLSASKRARRAGALRLGVRLSKAGRRQLEASGRLRVSLGVRFGGVSRSVSFGLVRASSGGRGR